MRVGVRSCVGLPLAQEATPSVAVLCGCHPVSLWLVRVEDAATETSVPREGGGVCGGGCVGTGGGVVGGASIGGVGETGGGGEEGGGGGGRGDEMTVVVL